MGHLVSGGGGGAETDVQTGGPVSHAVHHYNAEMQQ